MIYLKNFISSFRSFYKILFLFFILIFATALLFSAPNLLENGDFKSGGNGWEKSIGDPEDAVYEINDGILCMKRSSGKKYMFRFYQDIPVKPGSRYILSLYAKVEGHGTFSPSYYFEENNNWGKINYAKQKKEGDWEEIICPINIAPGCLKIRVQFMFAGVNAKAWLKNTEFSEADTRQAGSLIIRQKQGNVIIDGNPDDDIWKQGLSMDDFRVLGYPEEKAALNTKAYAYMSGQELFLGFEMQEPDPSSMLMMAEMDSLGIYADDCIEVHISTDRKNISHMLVNPNGHKWFSQHGTLNLNKYWYPALDNSVKGQGSWEAKAGIYQNKWTAEIRINMNSIFMTDTTKDPEIYINLSRHRPRNDKKQEYVNWAAMSSKRLAAPEEYRSVKLEMPPLAKFRQEVKTLRYTKVFDEPLYLIPGSPVKLLSGKEKIALPGSVKIIEKDVNIDPEVKKILAEKISLSGNTLISIELNANPGLFDLSSLNDMETKIMSSDEAYILDINPKGIFINSRTKAGCLRGIASLIMLALQKRFSEDKAFSRCIIYDAPRIKNRAMTINCRGSLAEEKEIIDYMFLLKLNQVFINLVAYDKGTLFRFKSHPGIIAENLNRPTEEYKELFRYARARGIDPVPWMASWTKTGHRTGKETYRHLGVRPDLEKATHWGRVYDKNMDSANPESFKILFELWDEIIEELKPSGCHIGNDEAYHDDMVSALAEKKGWKSSDWYREAVNKTAGYFKKKGVIMYMWADMLDPWKYGRYLDITGKDLLPQIDKNIVLVQWDYSPKFQRKDNFPFIKLGKEQGFKVYGGPWYDPANYSEIIQDVYAYQADGVCLTFWGETLPNEIYAEHIAECSAGSYLAWSPKENSLENILFPPSLFFKYAAYYSKNNLSYAENTRQIQAPDFTLSGNSLGNIIGFPPNIDINSIAAPVKNYRGAEISFFKKNGSIAGVAMEGNPQKVIVKNKNGNFSADNGTDSCKIIINGMVKYLSFLHTMNKQAIEGMKPGDVVKKYNNADIGSYRICYTDGSSCSLPLKYRVNINDWNDAYSGRFCEKGIFGILGDSYLINIPVLTWQNPNPDKIISYVELIGGTEKKITTVLFGLAAE